MVNAFILVLAFFLYRNTVAISFEQVYNCVNDNCIAKYSNCQSDTLCYLTFECLNSCNPNDKSCRNNCIRFALNDQYFWELNFCLLMCIDDIEVSEGIQVKKCQFENCISQMGLCNNDPDCLEAKKCAGPCNEKDYECGAQCVIAHSSNKNLTNLISCQSDCTWSYVH